MRSATWTIVLILLSACPAELSAQTARRPSVGTIAERPCVARAEAPQFREPRGTGQEAGRTGVGHEGRSAAWPWCLGFSSLAVWVFRRASPPGPACFRAEAFEVLGRAPLANRQQAHLLRCGNKLLLVSAGAAGVEPLTEITDPAEVDRLTDLCRQARPNVATTALRARVSAEGEKQWVTKGGRRKVEGGGNADHLRHPSIPGDCVVLVLCAFRCSLADAAEPARPTAAVVGLPEGLAAGPKAWTSPEGLGSSLQVMLLLAVVSLAPAALLMTTCYVRIVVVLSLLRQALGTQNLPPTQVITTLALFLTLLVMSPVWKQVYDESVVPTRSTRSAGSRRGRRAWRRSAAS